ncbi:MAG: dihydroneopterin aldolase [Thermoleophilia bacterium]|nr:dihydroneopterin aldolase [Thermoleophilia bacterium]
MTVEVALRGVELLGRHGVDDDERARPQRFRFDVTLVLASDAPAASDRLEDTVDYRAVLACVREVCTGREFRLLERLAAAVADELLRRFDAREARVTVTKPDVELGDRATPAVTVRRP